MEGDDDEEDIDDIEHEFNIDDQKKNTDIAEAMLHGKMSYGRGPEDEDNAQHPPVIAGGRSRPVRLEDRSIHIFQLIVILNSELITSHLSI